jgi:hypothetical protein
MPAYYRRGGTGELPPQHLTRPREGVTAIAVGDQMSAALHDGKLTVWGIADIEGNFVPFRGEQDVVLNITDIAVSGVGVLALLSNGSVVTYSYTNSDLQVPGAVTGARVASIASSAFGTAFVAVLAGTGELVAWRASSGAPYWVPAEVRAGVAAAACGYGRAVALLSNGSIVAWTLQMEPATDVQLLAKRGLRVAMGQELILAVVQVDDDAGSEDTIGKAVLLLVICLKPQLSLHPGPMGKGKASVVMMTLTTVSIMGAIMPCRSGGI